jgi:AraC-like DNA-binding protein
MATARKGEVADPGSTRLPRDLVRALAWLRGHLHDAVRLESLARVAGVAPRTLETHFKEFLGTTPLGWVRQTRLVHARRALLDPMGSASVTQVAMDSGFTQLGRFAAQYRLQFGEVPSQTLRRVRQGMKDEVDDEALRLAWGAIPAVFAVAPRQCAIALEELEQAQERAPAYGLPKALAAWCWGQRAAQHFSPTPDADIAQALRLAREACTLAPSDSLTLTLASGALTLAHRLEDADRLLERALALDPWSPIAWVRRGWASAYCGDSQGAMGELRTALHLMPFEPVRHLAFIGIGCAHFAAGRYEQAARWAEAGVEACPGSFWATRITAAAAVHAGARTQGRRLVRSMLRKDPSLTIAVASTAWPFPSPFMDRLTDGLAVAGLPRA